MTTRRLLLRRAGAAAVAVLVASVAVLAWVVDTRPVRLVSALPADGALLAAPPARVELTFSARPDPARSHLSIGTADGTRVPAGGAGAAGARMSVPLTLVEDGEYLVAYHAVFDGGRSVSGMLRFAVGSPTGGPTGDSPARAADPGDRPAPAADGHGHGQAGPGVTLAVSTALTALGLFALLLLRRRRVPESTVSR